MLNGKKICIFCSSRNKIDKIYYNHAKELASLLAAQGTVLIFGGGKNGLMDVIAETFKKNKNKAISIIPKKLNKRGVLFEESDDVIVTDTMNERKKIMENISDAFIALPGGFGTLEEILEIITLKHLGYHKKPISFFNVDGFYDFLFKQLDFLYNNKFTKKKYRKSYFISDNPEAIINYIKKNIYINQDNY